MIVHELALAPGVDAWFTGREHSAGLDDDLLGGAGNLAHRRPHRPADLARARDDLGRRTATSPSHWHLMHQVHGSEVAVVGPDTPVGMELREVDAAVTDQPDRPLVVQVADCVPILLAGSQTVAAVHAGRLGLRRGIVGRTLAWLRRLEAGGSALRAVVGPAIGGCCYEVPASMRDDVAGNAPAAAATTTWGTPSLDLPAAVTAELRAAGVEVLPRVGGCTRCDPQRRWFSHRADPASGRQVGMVVRRASPASAGQEVRAPGISTT